MDTTLQKEEMKQTALFDSEPTVEIAIDEVASLLNVSIASVRNWIKTGYLDKTSRNSVSIVSFETFKTEVLGTEKLNQRANKSLKDNHDHTSLESVIFEEHATINLDLEKLGDRYENKLSDSYRNKEGIFYTPQDIAADFFKHLPEDCSNLTFCDPCCGSGNFLVEAVKRGFKPSNVYGFDIDDIALRIARLRLEQYAPSPELNIENKDFLDISTHTEQAYDVVFTNPPWGKKLPKKEKDSLAKTLGCGNSKDTSAIFFFACINIVKNSGYLGFLLQEAFFNIASFENARKRALAYKIIGLIDFGKPFKGLVTKAKGIILKCEEPETNHKSLCINKNEKSQIEQRVFERNPKSIFNFTCSQNDLIVINHLLQFEHKTLAGQAQWGLGIVTGNNKRFLSHEPQTGYIPVFKGSDITRTGLKEPTSFIPDDMSKYQQVAPISLYKADEKLIYKFISSELVFFHDTEQRFLLNSANILALNSSFPIDHGQLCAILNSRLMTWLFQKLFDTHKILRADIDSLPIFINYFNHHEVFSESSFLDYLSLEEVSNGTYRIKE